MSASALYCRSQLTFPVTYLVLYWLVTPILFNKKWKQLFHNSIDGPLLSILVIFSTNPLISLHFVQGPPPSIEVWNQCVYTIISSRISVTNQYKTKYVIGIIIWALQSNALADIFGGNCINCERRKRCIFYPKKK